MSAIFGWDFLSLGFQFLGIWIACVFVSILIHELGHIFMGRLFGSEGHIILHSFGGLAVGSSNLLNPWKRIAVSAAGPIAQLAVYGALTLVPQERLPPSPYLLFALFCLTIINWYWPLLNLLPVYPLDGGQIVRDFLSVFIPRQALRASLLISATVAGIIALNSLSARYGGPRIPWVYAGGMYTAIFFGFMAAANVQALSQEMERKRWSEDHRVLYEDDEERWDR
ncbi:MAG: metalloprotease [Gemmataceae bacterium]